MAREIKFRAWLNGQDRYVGVDAIDFDEDSIRINGDYFFLADLEQYTGLTDKNGKEIYEGDVIAYAFDDEKTVGEIIFKEAGFIVKWKEAAWFSEKITAHLDIAVVIGNIHENPKLI